MPRLSIDISSEEHRKLKAIAALNGLSIKDYVVARTLYGDVKSDDTDDEALSELRTLLDNRLTQVKSGKVSMVTAAQIGQMARALGRKVSAAAPHPETGSGESSPNTTIGVPFRTRSHRSIMSWFISRTQPDEAFLPMLFHSGEPWMR